MLLDFVSLLRHGSMYNARVANVVTHLQDEVMNLIEQEGVPAPAPIEQRWTASSSASMSPAHCGSSPKTVRVELFLTTLVSFNDLGVLSS